MSDDWKDIQREIEETRREINSLLRKIERRDEWDRMGLAPPEDEPLDPANWFYEGEEGDFRATGKGWAEWLEAHPELKGTLTPAGVDENGDLRSTSWKWSRVPMSLRPVAPRRRYDDDELVAAVAETVRQAQLRWGGKRAKEGVATYLVADVIHTGDLFQQEFQVAQGDLICIGRALGRLAREGRLKLTSKHYEEKRYVPIEKKSRKEVKRNG